MPDTLRRRLLVIASAAVLTMALIGCRGAVVGDWRLVEASPNKEVFSIEQASFHRDGSFAATSTIEGKSVRERGTYDFDGSKLTLRPQAGGQRKYTALLHFNTLEVSDGNRKVILRKGS